MARLREIGLEFVDIIVKSDNEPAFDEFDRIVGQSASDEGRFADDRREQSSGQLEEQRNRRESQISQCIAWSGHCAVHSKKMVQVGYTRSQRDPKSGAT